MKIYFLNIILLFLNNIDFNSLNEEHWLNYVFRKEQQYRLQLGNLKIESYHKNERKDSLYQVWNSRGELITKGYYKNGKKDGHWIEWISYSSNYDFIRYNYDEGYLNDVYSYMSFVDDSSKISLEIYIKYTEDGGRIEQKYNFHENGKKADISIAYYDKQDNFTRNFKAWDENGTLFIEENIKNRKQHGVQKEWDSEGNLILEEHYDMGKLIKKVK